VTHTDNVIRSASASIFTLAQCNDSPVEHAASAGFYGFWLSEREDRRGEKAAKPHSDRSHAAAYSPGVSMLLS
jgi:hypothetical protein